MGEPYQQQPQQPMQPQYPPPQAGPPKGLATAAMVLGIVGLVFSIAGCTWFLGIPLDILGIVFGAVALAKVKSGQATGESMAKAGLICGIIGIVVVIVWFIIAFTILQDYYRSPWNY
jgi:site-specific recombinase